VKSATKPEAAANKYSSTDKQDMQLFGKESLFVSFQATFYSDLFLPKIDTSFKFRAILAGPRYSAGKPVKNSSAGNFQLWTRATKTCKSFWRHLYHTFTFRST